MHKTITILRWTTTIAGSAVALLILAIFVGESASGDPPNPLEMSGPEVIKFFGIILALAGLVLAWRFEMLGGLLVLAGLTTFMLIEKELWINWIFGLLGLVGLTHVLCGVVRGRQKTRHRG